MTANRSMTDVAYDILLDTKTSVEFSKLWTNVSTILGYDDAIAKKKLVQFYNDIMLDKRFAPLEDNKWDLRTRRKFEEIHVDTSAILIEDDDDDMVDADLDDELNEKSNDEEY